MAVPTATATAILIANAAVTPQTMAIDRHSCREHTGGVKQFVADDLGHEHRGVGRDEVRSIIRH
jgi:hypothetical protein